MPTPTRATVVIESNTWNQLAAVILDDGRYSITAEWCNYANLQVQAQHGQDDAEIDLFIQWLNHRHDHAMIVLDPEGDDMVMGLPHDLGLATIAAIFLDTYQTSWQEVADRIAPEERQRYLEETYSNQPSPSPYPTTK
ncbi:MAG: hypothetical protein K1X50_13000 [Candidatus Promineofilum sp.]|nr:hypothetical protein [Promineifilum sp.]